MIQALALHTKGGWDMGSVEFGGQQPKAAKKNPLTDRYAHEPKTIAAKVNSGSGLMMFFLLAMGGLTLQQAHQARSVHGHNVFGSAFRSNVDPH